MILPGLDAVKNDFRLQYLLIALFADGGWSVFYGQFAADTMTSLMSQSCTLFSYVLSNRAYPLHMRSVSLAQVLHMTNVRTHAAITESDGNADTWSGQ